ncbi:HutD family protein [Catenulispora sp. NL8]|uniref:HutD family protein n=1 Tax=Catenulispora pinistramenti TaxID=2705254 RepID=A0ABS5L134_9ACTN|nr:HutD family protein [Catenulispora pinistramenti]MBS2551974.1 HutD family protein [Catenulispora pinistramenti]
MSQTLVRWSQLKAVPWKNGGGIMRVLAREPAAATSDELDWSVSIAEIEADGPFSAFPGVDRVFMLIGGTELFLDVDGTPHRLSSSDTLAFSGDAVTTCRLPAGPVRALNLMTGRGRATGTSRAVEVAGAGAHQVTVRDGGEVVVLVALTGGLVLGGGDGLHGLHGGAAMNALAALDALDAVLVDASGSVAVTGNGLLAEIRIDRRGAA